MEAGAALTKIFENGIASGAISIDDMFDDAYVEICGHQSGAVPHQNSRLGRPRAAALPGSLSCEDPRMVFAAMVDRNGYLPVHNKIYSHPQRPGDVAWNTANSRNRRSSTIRRALRPAATSAPT